MRRWVLVLALLVLGIVAALARVVALPFVVLHGACESARTRIMSRETAAMMVRAFEQHERESREREACARDA